jgi:hypothetical protein
MGFDPYKRVLKIQESIWDSSSHNGGSLGSARVHFLTLFSIPRSMKGDSRASLSARNLASLCLGCKPKARVVTQPI